MSNELSNFMGPEKLAVVVVKLVLDKSHEPFKKKAGISLRTTRMEV